MQIKCTDKKCHILVIDQFLPAPDRDAGSLVTFNVLLSLKKLGWEVTFLGCKRFPGDDEYRSDLVLSGVNVLRIPFWMTDKHFFRSLTKDYECALIFRPMVAKKYMQLLKEIFPKIKIIYHAADLHFLRIMREFKLTKTSDKFKKTERLRRIEYQVFMESDIGIVHSTFEYELISTSLPKANIYVWPLILSVTENVKSFEDRSGLVFIGNFKHKPNLDALNFFINEILPLVIIKIPNIQFNIIGADMPLHFKTLASANINVIGYVKNLEQYLNTMRLSVCPLRYGAGIKGKIGLSMACGTPVIATPISVEGMELVNNRHVIVAENPQDFSDRIFEVYDNKSLWENLHSSGLDFATTNWGLARALQHLDSIFKSIGINSYKH
ncbi:glycosyltransferase [Polynucleobacter paneuropaeus]|nr:glycosyltransferase [Polynucleobacter paneuropaeus]